MIWNDDILFLHAPKTAGMSLTTLLIKRLKGKVYVTTPQKERRKGNVSYLPGKRHENLYDAESYFAYRNKSIFSFQKIFCAMRNPYDLELSRYTYLRKNKRIDTGPAQKIALNSSFKEYLQKAPFFGMNPPRLDMYYCMNNQLPNNLVVLRYENLENDIYFQLSPYLTDIDLGVENVSGTGNYKDVYDSEMEELCYLRHKWFFDRGFYSRQRFA